MVLKTWGSDKTLSDNFQTITKEEAYASNPLIATHDAMLGVMRENEDIKNMLFKAMNDLTSHKINSDDAMTICNDASIKLKAIKEELKAVCRG